MSWFYEALVRAEAKPRDDERVGAGTVTQGGESFLSEIEALSPTLVSARESTLEAAVLATPGPHKGPAPSPASKVVRASGFRHLGMALREDSRLVFHSEPMSMPAEQFRLLRRSLVQAFPAGGALMITSPGAGDGKTLTALNLCACLADAGDATLLV